MYVGETRLKGGGTYYTDPVTRWGAGSGHLASAREVYMKKIPIEKAKTRIDAYLAFFDFEKAVGVLFITKDYSKGAEKKWIRKMKLLSKGMNFVVVNK